MRRWPLTVCLAWTVFVWAGRIRNGGSVLLAASFLVLAAAVVVGWRRPWLRTAVLALTVWTVGVWAIRTPEILIHDHPVAFKAVHTVLAVVSVALVAVAQRHVERERETTTAATRL